MKFAELFAQKADSGALFTLLAKLSQSLASVLMLIALGRYFTLELQGYYYTFLSLTAMQVFAELGLYIVVSVLASHEWSNLKLDSYGQVVGDSVAISRLSSLLRFVFYWYAIAACVFVLVVGFGGYYFLHSVGKLPQKEWMWPWILHIGVSALLFWGTPILVFLEGCNQINDVAKFKLSQTICGACVFLLVVFAEGGLWALPLMSCSAVLFLAHYIFRKKKIFFISLLRESITTEINWKSEIFPMQWRLAVSGIASYFVMSSFVPIMFYHQGPLVAGQMGMTLQIMQAIQSIALIWLSVQTPKLGMLAASGAHSQMNSVWVHSTILSCLTMFLGGVVFAAAVYILHNFGGGIVDRILAPPLLLVLTVGMSCSVLIHCCAVNLRSYKQELLMPVSLVGGVLAGWCVWFFGGRYAATGAVYSYVALTAFFTLPLVIHIMIKSRSDRRVAHAVQHCI